MNKELVKALADLALFLEFTGEESLDPDVAVGAMEQLASTLQQMSAEEQHMLAAALRDLRGQYDDAEAASFVGGLPEALCLGAS